MRRLRAVRQRRMYGFLAALVLLGTVAGWAAVPDSVQTEYAQRSAQLKPNDIAGHYQLALWCKEQGAWDLVRKECTLVLAQSTEHADAKLLLDLAVRHLGESGPGREGKPATTAPAAGDGLRPRIVTDAEIRRIRWMEMLDEEPRQLSIQFQNNVIDRFLEAMQGTVGFTSREERREFNRLTPTEKTQLIRKHTGDRFAADIVIKSDPKRLADFERDVLPIVTVGCATAHCHGAPEAKFSLYTDRLLSKNKVYTNYLILHGYRVGDKRVIKRDTPLASLLLTYGFLELPAGLDPSYKHPTEIPALYRNATDPKYETVRQWLESLSAIEPDYGVSVAPTGSAP
jgi:hypothetical protein